MKAPSATLLERSAWCIRKTECSYQIIGIKLHYFLPLDGIGFANFRRDFGMILEVVGCGGGKIGRVEKRHAVGRDARIIQGWLITISAEDYAFVFGLTVVIHQDLFDTFAVALVKTAGGE